MNQPRQTGFFGQPAGLRTLFFAEMWERFSYYGMRAILVLFMTAPIAAGGLGWTSAKAGPVYGVYTAAVYLMSLPGGWIADRLLGQRKSVFWGGVMIMFGHIALAVPSVNTFYLGLILVVLGVGLLKPNISTMVGQLYAPDDERRDAGFSIFYMGINLGAMLAPLVVGYLAQDPGWKTTLSGWGIRPETSWHWGFGATAVGMFLGLVWYVVDRKALGDAGMHPGVSSPQEVVAARRQLWRALGGVGLVLAAIAVLQRVGAISVTSAWVADAAGVLLLLTVVVFFAWLLLSGDWTTEERRRLMVIAVLFLGASVFWSVFEQAGSTLTLFADRSTRNQLFGHAFPSSWWQSVNSGVDHHPGAGVRLAVGMARPAEPVESGEVRGRAAAGVVVVLDHGSGRHAREWGNRVGWWWLLSSYFLATAGELSLSPVGLSAMTRLAPTRVASLMMGVWFLAASVGNFIGGRVAGVYEKFSLPTLFGGVALYALLFAVVLALLVKPIKRMLERPA